MKKNGLFPLLLVMLCLSQAFTAYGWGNTEASAGFEERMAGLQTAFPHGTYLGKDYMYDASWQCVAYAKKICYEVFHTKWNTWDRHTRAEDPNLDGLSVGDYLVFERKDGNVHAIFITGLDGDTVSFTDANWTGPNQVRWGASITKNELLTNRDRYYHSYRHARNYTDVFPEKQTYVEGWEQDASGTFWKYRFADGSFAQNRFLDFGRDQKYYFDENGKMKADEWVQEEGKWYFAAEDGHMNLGWQKIENEWYYFYDPSGEMKVNGWKSDGDRNYYLSPGGRRYRNIIMMIDGRTYRFDENGSAVEVEKEEDIGEKRATSKNKKQFMKAIKWNGIPQ